MLQLFALAAGSLEPDVAHPARAGRCMARVGLAMNPAPKRSHPFGSEERRAVRCHDLRLPIVVHANTPQQSKPCHGKIRDISARGIYFVTERKYLADLELEFILALPAEITQGIKVSLRGHGRVLRTEERKEDRNACTGVAVNIERIDFIRAEMVDGGLDLA
jgi:hypothetical protein